MDTDVVVIGAGCAGLGAAAALQQAGKRCIVLEASSRAVKSSSIAVTLIS